MARCSVIFDTDANKKEALIQRLETTVDMVSGRREEKLLRTFHPSSVCLMKQEKNYLLEITDESSVLRELYEEIPDYDECSISKNQTSFKEIKIIPDVTNPNVYIILKGYIFLSLSVDDTEESIINCIFGLDETSSFVINSGVQLSLSHGLASFQELTTLSADERQFIRNIIEHQKQEDWVLPAKEQSKNTVAPDVYDEIKAVFNTLTSSEQEIINIGELKIIPGSESSQKELDQMIGMDNIKHEIEVLEAKLQYRKLMRKQGYVVNDTSSMHMCFLGSPGTGKTTVARIVTGILSKHGYIKRNKCIEINARQLIGSYIGQTPFKTATIIKAAKGGVLFIDEAYTLLPTSEQGHDYSAEAVAQLLKQMEDDRGDLIVILAGYNKDMQKFLDLNEGMRSRINKYMQFENYSIEETMEIFVLTLRKEALYITEAALAKIMLLVKKCCLATSFSNGRFVRNLFEKLLEEHSYIVYKQSISGKQADIITEAAVTETLCKQLLDAQR
jgi:AAA+ superfamily predicted ATPase